jgi:hypothetical protein
MLFDRRVLLQTFADKLAVRKYVASRLGSADILSQLYAVYESAEEIGRDPLPSVFVAKPNHGSGWLEIYDGKRSVDIDELRRSAAFWLNQSFYDVTKEWAYKNIRRAILIEEHLTLDVPDAVERSFFCFHGRVGFIRTRNPLAIRTSAGHRPATNVYSRDWIKVPVKIGRDGGADDEPRPQLLTEMVRVAECLSQETDFVRVDLYDLFSSIKFGELTNYPFAGKVQFFPSSCDESFGSDWHVPWRYR